MFGIDGSNRLYHSRPAEMMSVVREAWNRLTVRGRIVARPARVLFYVVNGLSFACLDPILRRMQVDPRFRIATTQRRRSRFDELKIDDRDSLRLYRSLCLPWKLARRLRWDLVISTHSPRPRIKRAECVVRVRHGTIFGCSEYSLRAASEDQMDVIFGLSETERAYMDRQRPASLAGGHSRFFAVGYPKADVLARGEYDRGKVRRELRLAADRPAVLIASHWTAPAILHKFGASLLERLARQFPEIDFVQTGHNMIWDSPGVRSLDYPSDGLHFDAISARELWDKLTSIARIHSNVRVVRTTAIESLMAAADLLVVDHSSALTIFTLVDRPILQFQNPDLQWCDPQIRDLCAEAVHGFRTLEELQQLLPFGLANPRLKTAGRRAVRENFLANAGYATDEAVKRLAELAYTKAISQGVFRQGRCL